MVSYYSLKRFSNTVNVCIVFWIRCITSFNSDFVTSLLSADTSCKFFEFCEWKMVLFLVNMWYFLGEDLGIGDIIGYCIFRLNFIILFALVQIRLRKFEKKYISLENLLQVYFYIWKPIIDLENLFKYTSELENGRLKFWNLWHCLHFLTFLLLFFKCIF